MDRYKVRVKIGKKPMNRRDMMTPCAVVKLPELSDEVDTVVDADELPGCWLATGCETLVVEVASTVPEDVALDTRAPVDVVAADDGAADDDDDDCAAATKGFVELPPTPAVRSSVNVA